MTNNQTIDGVSRELLERVAYRLSDLKQCELSETLFAILSNPFKCNFCDDKKSVCVDWEAGEWMSCPKCSPESNAPAVERQEPAICAQIQALLDIDARGSLAPHGIGGLARELLTKSKSTIAQLQARVQELESGRGEPVAWLYKNTSIGNQITHQCLDHYWPRPGSSYEHDYIKGEPLYTAPPAPVAAGDLLSVDEVIEKLGCFIVANYGTAKSFAASVGCTGAFVSRAMKYKRIPKQWLELIGVEKTITETYACLDATAALNEQAE